MAYLLEDPDEEWNTANGGKPINAHFLRSKLRGLIGPPEEGKPPKAADWYEGPAAKRTHHRGYLGLQFADAWERYLATAADASTNTQKTSGASGASGAPAGKAAEMADILCTSCNSASGAGEAVSGAFAPASGVADGGLGVASGDAPDTKADAPDAEMLSGAHHDQSQPYFRCTPDAPDAPDEKPGPGREGIRGGRTTATNGSAAVPPTDDAAEANASEVELINMIVAARAANPLRADTWLAKHIGLPVSVVRSYLKAAADPAMGRDKAEPTHSPLVTLRHCLGEARALGASFRLSGCDVLVAAPAALPAPLQQMLNQWGRPLGLLWQFLGGARQDAPSRALLPQLGVEVLLITTPAETRRAIRQLIMDMSQHGGHLGIDVETAPLPGFGQARPAVRLNKDGGPCFRAAGKDDEDRTGLDPHLCAISPRCNSSAGGNERASYSRRKPCAWSPRHIGCVGNS